MHGAPPLKAGAALALLRLPAYNSFMNPAVLLLGLTAVSLAGTAAYLALRKRGDIVILYAGVAPEPGHVGTFREVSGRAAQLLQAPAPAPVTDGQSLVNAIRAHRKIGTLLLIGHGSSTSFIRPGTSGLRIGATALPTWVGVETFAQELAPRLSRGFWIGFLGCRAAAETSETDWAPVTAGPGGARSLAGLLRDALVVHGAPSGRVGGHTTTGATDANPRAREFVVARRAVGTPGQPVPGITQGQVAVRWAFTGSIS
jgi:hypothetical protein